MRVYVYVCMHTNVMKNSVSEKEKWKEMDEDGGRGEREREKIAKMRNTKIYIINM